MAAGLVLTGGPLAAQTPTFRSSSQTVAIYATVTDQDGRLVPDLQQEHFEVFDNLKPAPITLFKSDVQPITVVVMLDTSGSMTMNLDLLKQAAERFVTRLLPADQARIGSFSEKIIISPTFTHDRDELIRILHNDIQFGNPTFLWDAIDESMTALSRETGRRVVLVFTDGEDETSQRRSFKDVLTRAQNEDYMIYAIGLESHILGQTTRPDRHLRQLAEATGGGYFELSRTADLNATFTRVADELHRQYVLGIDAQLDGTVHALDVRVKVPGMTARARKSYLAVAGATGLTGPDEAPPSH
ncbi:MAG TPA: VWA domain-containing protein [Vicinamibacterales bacterium]|nr:VWA domain-containing protein [Vicinamibacterales bacterium]